MEPQFLGASDPWSLGFLEPRILGASDSCSPAALGGRMFVLSSPGELHWATFSSKLTTEWNLRAACKTQSLHTALGGRTELKHCCYVCNAPSKITFLLRRHNFRPNSECGTIWKVKGRKMCLRMCTHIYRTFFIVQTRICCCHLKLSCILPSN